MSEQIASWKWRIYKAGLTQADFCKRFDLAESQLSDWLQGKKAPKPYNIDKIENNLKELGV